jgi:hypothetical protein
MKTLRKIWKDIPVSPRYFYENRASEFLTDAHLRALGRVAAEWGLLEYALAVHGSNLLRLPLNFRLLTGNPGGAAMAELLVGVPKWRWWLVWLSEKAR